MEVKLAFKIGNRDESITGFIHRLTGTFDLGHCGTILIIQSLNKGKEPCTLSRSLSCY